MSVRAHPFSACARVRGCACSTCYWCEARWLWVGGVGVRRHYCGAHQIAVAFSRMTTEMPERAQMTTKNERRGAPAKCTAWQRLYSCTRVGSLRRCMNIGNVRRRCAAACLSFAQRAVSCVGRSLSQASWSREASPPPSRDSSLETHLKFSLREENVNNNNRSAA